MDNCHVGLIIGLVTVSDTQKKKEGGGIIPKTVLKCTFNIGHDTLALDQEMKLESQL